MAGKAALQASRFDAFWLEPEKLKLIVDKSSPFYQARAEEPPDADLVRSMKAVGFLASEAISVFKDGATVCVLDGRRRTIAAREANRQLRAEKREPLRVSAILKKGTEADLYAVQCASNENRTGVSDVERARELSKLMAYGKTVDEAGAVLGFNKGKAQRILALLDCSAAVQHAVEADKLSATAAAPLAKLERAEQDKKLAKLLAESGGKRVRVRRVMRAVRKGDAAEQERPSRKAIQELLDTGKLSDDAAAALRWVLTGEVGQWMAAALGLEVPAETPAAVESAPVVEPVVESKPEPLPTTLPELVQNPLVPNPLVESPEIVQKAPLDSGI